MNSLPVVAITMGCPVGVGPEIILKCVPAIRPQSSGFQPVVVGHAGVLARQAAELGVTADIVPWRPGRAAEPGAVNILEVPEVDLDAGALRWGRPDAATGAAMAAWITAAHALAARGDAAAMVTCPIAKSTLKAAGYGYPGHTEMLAELCGCRRYAMMMAGASLRVVLATIHQSLASVPAALTAEGITALILLAAESLQCDFGIPNPRIAVAGLNPHAGEDTMFGREEEECIVPAVAAAAAAGWRVSGPYPPDTVFHRAASGHFDLVVCMYHDQGLIPFKLLHFKDGVNVTIGLPVVRTSVDHGTAYDIAGKGRADASSLAAACALAAEIARNRARSAN